MYVMFICTQDSEARAQINYVASMVKNVPEIMQLNPVGVQIAGKN